MKVLSLHGKMGFIGITLGTLKWGVILGYPTRSDLITRVLRGREYSRLWSVGDTTGERSERYSVAGFAGGG